MGTGYLKVEVSTAFEALPVPSSILVMDSGDNVLYQLSTDRNGMTEAVPLQAPDAYHTMSPSDAGPFYATYDVQATAEGYAPVIVRGVQVFDGETSILPVHMEPLTSARSLGGAEITIPAHDLAAPAVARMLEWPEENRMLRSPVVIPDYITVHLGAPASSASNVRVSFKDYIKNVASSEIYPTWPQASLEANIYCQISFALNRVYTEWYISRGYAFHITSSTSYDQSYQHGRNIFANISVLVDGIFNTFVRRQGYAEPYFTQYCNGTTVTCKGLSQWGTVTLANQGRDAYQILRSYYPADIQLVASNVIGGITESYPGTPLRQGSTGESVRLMQTYLNRIRINYPLIPAINNVDGVFGADTTSAVRTFQSVFNLTVDGIVGKATWYKIVQMYTGIKKLADLESEGERIGIGANPPTSVLREGSSGRDVVQLQFILNYLAEFYADIPEVLENSRFDARTRLSVVAFQRRFGLTADGTVGPATWIKLYEVYRNVDNNVDVPGEGTTPPVTPPGTGVPPYPGQLVRMGSRGDSVRQVQQCLNSLQRYCRAPLGVDGIFGQATYNAVVSFQQATGLGADGIVGPQTWNTLMNACG